MKKFLVLGAAALTSVACSGSCSRKVSKSTLDKMETKEQALKQEIKEQPLKQEVKDMPKDFIEIVKDSGFGYKDEKVGEGRSPQMGDVVVVHYTGWTATKDGEPDMSNKFDSSVDRGEKFEFNIGVGQVIKGWDQGVISMKIGGKRRLLIPHKYGYGLRGFGHKIPGGATLIFDVELFDVK